MKPFTFKQFAVAQDKCAMKIGTDAVLLGAWTSLDFFPNSILDIGTGTGILALQMAQRSNAEIIDALEIDGDAFEQAVDNFEQSDWGDRLFCYHASLTEFVDEMDDKYDLIISNPPFFTSTYKKDKITDKRVLARHVESLPFSVLLQSSSKLLTTSGNCAFVIPYEEEENFLKIAAKNKLFPNSITHVKGTENSPIKRSLLQLSFQKTEVDVNELVIEIKRHQYTEAYIDVVKDFYLKM